MLGTGGYSTRVREKERERDAVECEASGWKGLHLRYFVLALKCWLHQRARPEHQCRRWWRRRRRRRHSWLCGEESEQTEEKDELPILKETERIS